MFAYILNEQLELETYKCVLTYFVLRCSDLAKLTVITWCLVYCCAYVFRKAILSGLTAGAVAQFIASPTDLVKIHMQMEGKLRLEGHPPR